MSAANTRPSGSLLARISQSSSSCQYCQCRVCRFILSVSCNLHLSRSCGRESWTSSCHSAWIRRSFWLHRTTDYATVLLPLPGISNDLEVCQGRGIAVLVHCGGNMRVSHQFLLHSHGCSGLVQPCSVCVTERVKPDSAKSQFQTCRNQVVGANRVCVIRSTCHRTREEPVSFGIETERLPLPQFENEAPFDWNLVLRILRLQFAGGVNPRVIPRIHASRVIP
jgi:hypothetical protein